MAKVRLTADQKYAIRCPACRYAHVFDERWRFNGDLERPTFRDSMRVQWDEDDEHFHCHSYVTDGQIEFLPDSLHEMAGKTVPLEDW